MSRTVLITGCSSGVGLSMTKKILEEPSHVVGLSRKDPSRIFESPYFHFERCDLNDLGIAKVIFKRLLKQYPNINTIICNAAIGQFSKLEDLSEAAVLEMIQVNFTSHVLLIKTFLPLLKTRPSNIIFIGPEKSTSLHQGGLYLTTKFALESFAENLQKEASSIKIDILHPITPGSELIIR